jgi:hypothetical protein
LQERAASFDATLFSLVADARVFEQRFVYAEEAASKVVELLSHVG